MTIFVAQVWHRDKLISLQRTKEGKEVRDKVLKGELRDSFLVHFFDNWGKVQDDESRWQYGWKGRLLSYNEKNQYLEQQSDGKEFQMAVSIACSLLKDVGGSGGQGLGGSDDKNRDEIVEEEDGDDKKDRVSGQPRPLKRKLGSMRIV